MVDPSIFSGGHLHLGYVLFLDREPSLFPDDEFLLPAQRGPAQGKKPIGMESYWELPC